MVFECLEAPIGSYEKPLETLVTTSNIKAQPFKRICLIHIETLLFLMCLNSSLNKVYGEWESMTFLEGKCLCPRIQHRLAET